MRYEKKMLILSGESKGVVLMEKSALGVKFALRTFSFPATAGLKVGVVARSCVYVRELPDCADPSLVFYIDDSGLDLTYLHFAVFDGALRLYGSVGKRMWESNLMDLLRKADRLSAPPAVLSQSAEAPAAFSPPPLSRLPDPDGSGTPQLRAIYGDDLIAGDNYYTPFDISARMKEVDGFLDTPRVLGDIAPQIERRANNAALPTVEPEHDDGAPTEKSEPTESETAEESDMQNYDDSLENNEVDVREEAAATADLSKDESDTKRSGKSSIQPWERSAGFLKQMSAGEVSVRRETVAAVAPKAKVKRVRESSFFERCRADVDKLFSSAAKDGELNAILPDIEWIKVPFDGHTVSVGRGGDVFLCYAVQGIYQKISPFGNEAQWLPKHKNAPTGRGYWLIFQDLKSGGIIGV